MLPILEKLTFITIHLYRRIVCNIFMSFLSRGHDNIRSHFSRSRRRLNQSMRILNFVRAVRLFHSFIVVFLLYIFASCLSVFLSQCHRKFSKKHSVYTLGFLVSQPELRQQWIVEIDFTFISSHNIHIFSFLPARRYASAGLCDSDVSVCPSVCPSVTRRYCAQQSESRIVTRRKIRKGSPPKWCQMRGVWVFSTIFNQYVVISKTVHFRHKVTMGR